MATGRVRRMPSSVPERVRTEVAERHDATRPGDNPVSCFLCGEPGTIHRFVTRRGSVSRWVWSSLDFTMVIPAARGGLPDAANVVLLCQQCRSRRRKN